MGNNSRLNCCGSIGIPILKVKEMANRYWFTILHCLLEKLLSGSDFNKNEEKM